MIRRIVEWFNKRNKIKSFVSIFVFIFVNVVLLFKNLHAVQKTANNNTTKEYEICSVANFNEDICQNNFFNASITPTTSCIAITQVQVL
ncbi:MAG: hypothetical protein C4540_05195 [Candidatus Omnitrophota bacterium]|nr:MAG: hypothetical protein C4540_05195 [Candidatus Omnitrophota bacterium]